MEKGVCDGRAASEEWNVQSGRERMASSSLPKRAMSCSRLSCLLSPPLLLPACPLLNLVAQALDDGPRETVADEASQGAHSESSIESKEAFDHGVVLGALWRWSRSEQVHEQLIARQLLWMVRKRALLHVRLEKIHWVYDEPTGNPCRRA